MAESRAGHDGSDGSEPSDAPDGEEPRDAAGAADIADVGGDAVDKVGARGEPQDAVQEPVPGRPVPESPAPGRSTGNGVPGPRAGWDYPAPSHTPLLADLRSAPPGPVRTVTLCAVLATGVLSMLLLGDGLALNLLIVAVPAALAAYFAAQAAGRRPRPWSLAWAVGGLALLVVPALRDAGWPSFLAIVSAVALGSLALHGCRTWLGVLLSPLGIFDAVFSGVRWGWQGLRRRAGSARGFGPVLRAVAVTAVLLLVFGALFAGADAAFAGLLGDLIPDASIEGSPWRFLLLIVGVVGALAAAHTAAAPVLWDRLVIKPGRARARVEWALPLIVLNVLFAAFNAVQLTVLFGGYDAVLDKTGLSYSAYARQGFWQLLLATLLTLLVIVFALRWAPRDGAGDRTLVRGVLGTLCALTLVVVASAVRRMDMYVEAYGLTRLRISVVAGELWLGVVILLIMAAGIWGTRWLPRAVAASAAAGVLAFGLLSPDALIAERNVQRYTETGKFDLDYMRQMSADAVPALDKLPEPQRSCAIEAIMDRLGTEGRPWYATSLGESRARRIAEERPPTASSGLCDGASADPAYG
ncbi:hypothetical protein KY5_5941 [Streptomyces formicae]|uniref:Uncharacterized protein n=1 Tax=Streptomyces formicae TaxID=1616117 RepID=A0A291QGW6_9ACTN|nr:hypothetical protein KY5_5941 [Streptomyces formicae]